MLTVHVIGPTKSGKSTLLRAIQKLLEDAGATVEVRAEEEGTRLSGPYYGGIFRGKTVALQTIATTRAATIQERILALSTDDLILPARGKDIRDVELSDIRMPFPAIAQATAIRLTHRGESRYLKLRDSSAEG